jgi:predicted amidohydrolase YtcJ
MAFTELDRAGKLTLNVAICIPTPYGARNTALDYAQIEAVRSQYRTPRVRADFVKLFLDGVPTPARTAAMLAPYLPDQQHGAHFKGDLHVQPAVLNQDVAELDKRGFTVKMHAAGDRSVRVALDAIENARKLNGDSGLHHEVAHASFIDPTDVPRFAKLDAIPDYSPIIWYPSSITQAVFAAVGKERGEHFWPTRDLLDTGAKVAAGSDWPAAVPDENPWMGIEALVTRQDPRGLSPGSLWKEQAITLPEALRIYTINGARALRLEKQTGSIEVGKSADLIVLDRNLFRIPIGDVSETKVRMTWFEGRLVHETHP